MEHDAFDALPSRVPDMPADMSSLSREAIIMMLQALPQLACGYMAKGEMDNAKKVGDMYMRVRKYVLEADCNCEKCTAERAAAKVTESAEAEATAAIHVAKASAKRAPDGGMLH